MGRLLVLKLGGSLITDKGRPYCMRPEVMRSVSGEIRSCLDEGLVDRLVIVHGVGSYGHPPVIEHKLHKGFIGPGQLMPISRTQSKVNELRTALTSCLQDAGVPVNLFHTSSIATAEKGRIVSMHLDAVLGFQKLGMVPVLGGDMVQDTAMGFSVGSGDQVAVMLAKELGASDLVFATDVAGVYDGDPKTNPKATLLRELGLERMASFGPGGTATDASGAMGGKLANLVPLKGEMEKGLRVAIMSMMGPGRLTALLRGEEFIGTSIRA